MSFFGIFSYPSPAEGEGYVPAIKATPDEDDGFAVVTGTRTASMKRAPGISHEGASRAGIFISTLRKETENNIDVLKKEHLEIDAEEERKAAQHASLKAAKKQKLEAAIDALKAEHNEEESADDRAFNEEMKEIHANKKKVADKISWEKEEREILQDCMQAVDKVAKIDKPFALVDNEHFTAEDLASLQTELPSSSAASSASSPSVAPAGAEGSTTSALTPGVESGEIEMQVDIIVSSSSSSTSIAAAAASDQSMTGENLNSKNGAGVSSAMSSSSTFSAASVFAGSSDATRAFAFPRPAVEEITEKNDSH
ncbi:unnamed protein product [Amoebophrya sp. A120]|nr:unnamed protein product [Amoebophrya sp. A120]|eukprot:GSA120T00024745001.1